MAGDNDNSEITFVIPGQRMAPEGRTRGGGAAVRGAQALPGRVKDAVMVGARRAGGEAVRIKARPGEDVVVLHMASGPSLVLHPETARDLLLGQAEGADAPKRGARGPDGREPAAPGEVRVPAELAWRGLEQAAPTRGSGFLGKVLLSAVEVLTDLVSDKAAEYAAGKVAAHVDGL